MTPREAFSTLLQSVAAEGLSPRLNQEWAAQSGVMGVASKQPRQLAAAYIAVRIWLDWCFLSQLLMQSAATEVVL